MSASTANARPPPALICSMAGPTPAGPGAAESAVRGGGGAGGRRHAGRLMPGMAADEQRWHLPGCRRYPGERGGVRAARDRAWERAGAFPQVCLAGLAECGTHALTAATMGACTTGETTLARDLLPALDEGILVLAAATVAVAVSAVPPDPS